MTSRVALAIFFINEAVEHGAWDRTFVLDKSESIVRGVVELVVAVGSFKCSGDSIFVCLGIESLHGTDDAIFNDVAEKCHGYGTFSRERCRRSWDLDGVSWGRGRRSIGHGAR